MDKDRLKAFSEKIFSDMAGAMVAGLGYVAVRTGLFNTMQGKGPMKVDDVVRASGLQPRYVEEWLKGMVAARYLDYDPAAEAYTLPEELGYLVASEGTDHYMGGLFRMATALLAIAPKVSEAFVKGGGVPFSEYGEDCVTALDEMNRGNYEHRFGSYWLKALPGVAERLTEGGRMLDVGCGVGRVSMSLARTFPKAYFVGVDTDPASVERASREAGALGLQNRVRFLAQSASALDASQKFDLITICDCVHDLAKPTATLAEIRSLLKPDGVVFVVEPKAADKLEDNRHPIAAMYYGISVFHCMTQSLAKGGPGLGTCMGPARTSALMREAGFSRIEVLDIKSQVNSFYAARR